MVTIVLGAAVIMLFALIGVMHVLDRMDRRRPGDLRRDERDPFVTVPMPRPVDGLAPRRVIVMSEDRNGRWRA